MAKLPYFPLYIGDWKKDPCVTLCSLATRAVWIELLLAMHEAGRSGEVAGTPEQMAAMCRCSVPEFKAALLELTETKTAKCVIRNGKVTVINRRMKREAKERRGNALRQARYRESRNSNAPSSMSSSISRSTDDRLGDHVRVTSESEIETIKQRARKVVELVGRPAERPGDRSLVVKAAILSLRPPFSEHWLYDAAGGVVATNGAKAKRYGYLHQCFANSTTSLGLVFNKELAKIRIPAELHDFDAPNDLGQRLVEPSER